MTDAPSPNAADPGASGPTGSIQDQAMGDWSSASDSQWRTPVQAWAPSPPPETAIPDDSGTQTAQTWQQSAPAGWPAPRAGEEIVAVAEAPADVAQADQHPDAAGISQNTALTEAIQRADQLLDELRNTVATISRTQAPDLSGVISELEVALTPPAALQPDDLAALRDTLHSAGERPRDIDTILDLTGKLSTLSALVIAYDRSIAAIERSLDTLRGSASIDHAAWDQ
jgi:hypothetical protein